MIPGFSFFQSSLRRPLLLKINSYQQIYMHALIFVYIEQLQTALLFVPHKYKHIDIFLYSSYDYHKQRKNILGMFHTLCVHRIALLFAPHTHAHVHVMWWSFVRQNSFNESVVYRQFILRIYLSFWCRFVSFCVNMDNKEENLLLKEVKEKYFRNEIYVSWN